MSPASRRYGHYAVDRVRDVLYEHQYISLELVTRVHVGDRIWRGLERARAELPTQPGDEDAPGMQVHGVEVVYDRRLADHEVRVCARRSKFD